MPIDPTPARALDVVAVFRRAVDAWWQDFAPITVLGVLLLSLPELIVRALGQAGERLGVLPLTATLICTAIFVAAVNLGIMHRFAGRPLGPRPFIATGLSGARPGIIAALMLMTGAFTIGILIVIAQWTGPLEPAIVGASIGLSLFGVATFLPAVPAALIERLGPVATLERAAELTRGNRARLIGLVLLVGLAAIPIGIALTLIIFGANPTPHAVLVRTQTMTLADPAAWIDLLVSLLATSIIACIPGAAYAELLAARRPRHS